MSKEVIEFLKEYEKLCRKYKMGLAGCGCCGSPYLVKDEDYVPILWDIDYLPSMNKVRIEDETIKQHFEKEGENNEL